MKSRFGVLVLSILFSSSLLGGFIGGNAAAGQSAPQTTPNEFLNNFTEALDIIQKTHVDNVGSDKLVYSAIKGMLRALDPHSSFFDPRNSPASRRSSTANTLGWGSVFGPCCAITVQ